MLFSFYMYLISFGISTMARFNRLSPLDNSPVELNFGHFQFVITKNNLSLPSCRLTNFARLVNGKDAFDQTYPFAALLILNGKPYGGGAIIGKQWILTAAHNFHRSNSADDFTIGVGSIYLDKLKIVKVEKILIHPSYIHKQKFDIAMLKLTQNLTFSNTIRPICLPEYSFEPLNSNKARVIGWGYKKFEMKKVSSVLQEVDLEIIPLERCQTIYMPLQQDIVRSQICTWSSGKDACSVCCFI